MDRTPLSSGLPGTWRLLSRTDVTAVGAAHPDPALGSDPVALLNPAPGSCPLMPSAATPAPGPAPEPASVLCGAARRRADDIVR